jgi:hypothetical protein
VVFHVWMTWASRVDGDPVQTGFAEPVISYGVQDVYEFIAVSDDWLGPSRGSLKEPHAQGYCAASHSSQCRGSI